jgi:hypothetical protein
VADLSARFIRDLFTARARHQRDRESEHADSAEAIKMRMDLGTIADEMKKAVTALEVAVRKEMRP